LIKIKKNSGPKILPWGVPRQIFRKSEKTPSNLTPEIGNRVFFKSEYEYEYLENHNSKSE
jgi:hypothetical protein